jgi:hypothetical protein
MVSHVAHNLERSSPPPGAPASLPAFGEVGARRQDAGAPGASRAAAEQLIRLLTEFDPGAADFIEAQHALLRPLFTPEAWEQLRQHVQGYAFQEGQALAEAALRNASAPAPLNIPVDT